MPLAKSVYLGGTTGDTPSFQHFYVGSAGWASQFCRLLVDRLLVQGFSSNQDAVFFVNVGGAYGQEILEMKQRIPALHGRTVLQDLPNVIKGCSETHGLEIVAHNFFEPQPIRGK